MQGARAAAKEFFSAGNDPIYTILKAQTDAYSAGQLAAATDLGFDALDEIAVARGGTRQKGAGTEGNALVLSIVACMDVGTVPDDFNVASSIDRGLFEVRGGAGDDFTAALAYVAGPDSKEPPPTMWGVEASNTWAATFAGSSSRYLVYGSPRAVSDFTSEQAAVDPNEVVYTGFDISTLPATPGLAFSAPLRPGICAEEIGDGVVNRLLHGDENPVVLALSPLTFCTDPSIARSESGVTGMVRRVASYFAPAAVHAYFRGGVGGLASALSPFGPVQVNIGNGSLVYTVQPTPVGAQSPSAVKVRTPFPVSVRVTTSGGTPIEGANVVVTVFGNNGQPVTIAGGEGSLTGTDGIAEFSLVLTKTGGYRLSAVADLGGSTSQPITSELFTAEK